MGRTDAAELCAARRAALPPTRTVPAAVHAHLPVREQRTPTYNPQGAGTGDRAAMRCPMAFAHSAVCILHVLLGAFGMALRWGLQVTSCEQHKAADGQALGGGSSSRCIFSIRTSPLAGSGECQCSQGHGTCCLPCHTMSARAPPRVYRVFTKALPLNTHNTPVPRNPNDPIQVLHSAVGSSARVVTSCA